MKKVFNSSYDVIHLFAQRSQTEANCKNVFFESDRIYSYGHHYLLAEFIKNDSGDEAIMINNAGYSVTTSKHISEVTQATRQYKQFFTLQTDPAKVSYQLTQLADKLSKAKKPELYINPAEYLFTKFNEFQNWRGLTNDTLNLLKINDIIKVFRGSSYAEYLQEQNKRIKQAEETALIQARKQFKISLKKFFNYELNYIYNNPTNEDYLRISEDKEYIETSQHVTVPIREAKVLYNLIKAKKDIKGFNISGYTVIGLNGVLKIGCHKINLKNLHEIGEKILTM
jgi:hypothetical protein